MDIKFIKREELQEKPDQKKLGFGKYFADYIWTMMKELAGMTQPFVRTDQLR